MSFHSKFLLFCYSIHYPNWIPDNSLLIDCCKRYSYIFCFFDVHEELNLVSFDVNEIFFWRTSVNELSFWFKLRSMFENFNGILWFCMLCLPTIMPTSKRKKENYFSFDKEKKCRKYCATKILKIKLNKLLLPYKWDARSKFSFLR